MRRGWRTWGEFVAWLQLPPAGHSGAVAVLPSAVPQVSVSTVNRNDHPVPFAWIKDADTILDGI